MPTGDDQQRPADLREASKDWKTNPLGESWSSVAVKACVNRYHPEAVPLEQVFEREAAKAEDMVVTVLEATCEEPQAVREAVGVRASDEKFAVWSQERRDMVECSARVAEVLDEVTHDDEVERLVQVDRFHVGRDQSEFRVSGIDVRDKFGAEVGSYRIGDVLQLPVELLRHLGDARRGVSFGFGYDAAVKHLLARRVVKDELAAVDVAPRTHPADSNS